MDKMKEMRIVHINLSGSNGGAAIAAYRLHCEMRKNGFKDAGCISRNS